MARSRKKSPVFKAFNNRKAKRAAAKRARKKRGLSQGSAYKKGEKRVVAGQAPKEVAVIA